MPTSASRPEFQPIYGARSGKRLYARMRKAYGDDFDPAQPNDWFPAS